MEKNETLYKKVEDKVHSLYNIYRHGTTMLMAVGGVSLLDGYLTEEKALTALGCAFILAGGLWKLGAFSSEKRFEPVSELEEKVEEK